jgi:hypothetical protein
VPFDEDYVLSAIEDVSAAVSISCSEASSHCVTMVKGIEADEAVKGLARYLIAAALQVVQIDQSIAAHMFGIRLEIKDVVINQLMNNVGTPNQIDDQFRCDTRDPWIGEGIAHLLLRLISDHHAGKSQELHAQTHLHRSVKEQGLDVVGIYSEQECLGLTIVEAKTSEQGISNHITDTANIYAEVDRGIRELELRGTVGMLLHSLDARLQEKALDAFWNDRRVYQPVGTYCAACRFEPTQRRPRFADLAVANEHIRLVCVPITNYRGFFDGVAKAVQQDLRRL